MLFTRPFSGQSRSTLVRSRNATAAKPVETLESRSLLSVSLGSDGFTDIVKSSDSKVIYVSSSSGSDSNSGSITAPVRSIAKGISLMRSGYPDHVLLKRGDSWTEQLQWSKSGRSSQEPALLGAYGSGNRPMIKAGSGTALEMTSGTVNHLAIQGVHLFAHTRDPNISGYSSSSGEFGIRFLSNTSGLLIEDTVIDQFRFGLLIQDYHGSQYNVKIRRSIITDSYSNNGGHSSGIYAHGVNGLTLEENVWHHNGWNSQVSGGGATSQNHNAYLTEQTTNVVVKGNIFADASSHGLQARGGGEIRDNLFVRNPIGMTYGLVNGAAQKAGGVTGVVDGNVFLESRLLGSTARGWAMELGNIKGATVSNNIITDDGPGTAAAINLGVGKDLLNASSGVGINNLVIENNVIHKWHRGLQISGELNIGGSGNTGLNNLTFRNNDVQYSTDPNSYLVWHSDGANKSEEFFSGNRYYDEINPSGWFVVGGSVNSLASWQSKLESTAKNLKVTYNNPNANLSTYAGSYASFISEARKASSTNWRSTYTARGAINYMRGAFNKSTSTTPSLTTDTTQPQVKSYTTSATAVTLTFSENVSGSLTNSDLEIYNSSGVRISTSSTAMSYSSSTNTATWTFPGLTGDKLASGTYSLKLPDQNVTDAAGNRLAGGTDWTRTFTVSSTSGTQTGTGGVVVVDTTNPLVVSRTANSTSIRLKFSENVGASVNASDLILKKSTGTLASNVRVSYNSSTNEATWTYSTLSSGTWTATIYDQNITDAAGNKLGGGQDYRFSFTV